MRNKVIILSLASSMFFLSPNATSNEKILHQSLPHVKKEETVQKGWVENNHSKQFIDDNGELHKGWLNQGDKWFFFDEEGNMKKGFVYSNNEVFSLNDNGEMQKGFITYQNDTYYFDQDGKMKRGWIQIDDKQYFADNAGIIQKGWSHVEGQWKFFSGEGVLEKEKDPWNGRIVIIDPSLGGSEEGVVSGTIKEKDTTAQIADKLRETLEKRGVQIVIARTDDKFTPKEDRIDLSNATKPHAFISLAAKEQGVHTYYYGELSKMFANKMKDSFKNHDFSVKQDSEEGQDPIIKENVYPSVLLNVGDIYHSSNPSYQDKIVNTIVDGLDKWFKE